MASSCVPGGGWFVFPFMFDRKCVLFLIVSSLLVGSAEGAAADKSKVSADRLVDLAIQAELAGDLSRSFSLLHEAVRVDPENRLARWHLGEVQLDNKWMTAEEAQRRASVDPRQAEYRDRRNTVGQSPQGQLALARWCRKNDLNDEAQFHWATVLAIDPKNEEALRALDVRWEKGRLVSRTQSAQEKDRMREFKRAAE